jgi:hypothetical protein
MSTTTDGTETTAEAEFVADDPEAAPEPAGAAETPEATVSEVQMALALVGVAPTLTPGEKLRAAYALLESFRNDRILIAPGPGPCTICDQPAMARIEIWLGKHVRLCRWCGQRIVDANGPRPA